MKSNSTNTSISTGTQEMIFAVAADPEQAFEATEALAAQTDGSRIKVTIPTRQRRPVRLTLKLTVKGGGEKVVSLPEEAGE
jgi:hypothetical protein